MKKLTLVLLNLSPLVHAQESTNEGFESVFEIETKFGNLNYKTI